MAVRYRRVDSGDHGGEYVTEEYAKAHPDTTVAETVPDPDDDCEPDDEEG